MLTLRNIISNCKTGVVKRLDNGFLRFNMTSTKTILYGDEASPPVRFAMWTAASLGIKVEFHKIDLFKAENKSESYKKINFLQKVPSLAIGNQVIRDSHAIALYLCEISLSRELYPNDALLKAKIHQMMFYNSSTLFPIDSFLFTSYFAGKWPVENNKLEEWYTAIDYLEYQLGKHEWLADDKMLLCDICCAATVTSLQLLVPLLPRHTNVDRWLNKLKETSHYNINDRGLKRLKLFLDTFH